MAAMRHGLGANADPRAHIFPVNDVFETADGQRMTLGILEEHFWQNFVKLEPSLADERFASDAKRRANGDVLSAVLKKIFAGRTAGEWMKILDAGDIPA